MLQVLFSIYVWIVWGFHLLVLGPLVLPAVMISPKKWGLFLIQSGSRSAFWFARIKVRAVNFDRVDWNSSQVFMANHQNLLDHFALCTIVPRHLAGVEKIENFSIPVYGALTKAWGNIAIKREDRSHSHSGISDGTSRLHDGASLLIFPEGTRTKDGYLGPFKKGGFHMAIDAGVPITPFTINGCYQRLRNGDWKIKPGEIELVFGETVPTEPADKEHLEDLMARVRGVMLSNFRDPKSLPEPLA